MLDRAPVRVRIDPETCQLDLVIALFTIHLREDTVARGTAEGLQRLFEASAFSLAKICAICEPSAFLDNRSEEVLLGWINAYLASQFNRLEAFHLSYRLQFERLHDVRNLSS